MNLRGSIVLLALMFLSSCGKDNRDTQTISGFNDAGEKVQQHYRADMACLKVWTSFDQACVDAGFQVTSCLPAYDLCSGQP